MVESMDLSIMDLGRMMQETFRVFKKRIENQDNDEVKLSSEQFSLLHALSQKEEEVIQKDMAEFMGKDKSAVLRIVDCLEEKGLVRRVASTEDRRKNYLMVTKAGYRAIDHYMKIVFQIMKELRDGITQEDLIVFHQVVNQIRSNAAKM
jgi:MarR family transcriptional regulator, transcriptional regulator for hemolysin